MKLCTYVIPSQRAMFKEFLEPSALKYGDFGASDLVVRYGAGDEVDVVGRSSKAFKDTARARLGFLLQTVKAYPGETILHTDADLMFCGPAKERIEELLGSADIIAMQAGHLFLNIGFMAIRSTPSSLTLVETLAADAEGLIDQRDGADEYALGIIQRMLDWRRLPYREFWNLGYAYRAKKDLASLTYVAVPSEIRIFHACFMWGLLNKLWLLNRVRDLLSKPAPRLLVNLPSPPLYP